MSNKIESCHYCTTKRHPGCHATCKEYKDERAEYERQKAEENKSKNVDYYSAERIERLRDRFAKDKKRPHRRGGYID